MKSSLAPGASRLRWRADGRNVGRCTCSDLLMNCTENFMRHFCGRCLVPSCTKHCSRGVRAIKSWLQKNLVSAERVPFLQRSRVLIRPTHRWEKAFGSLASELPGSRATSYRFVTVGALLRTDLWREPRSPCLRRGFRGGGGLQNLWWEAMVVRDRAPGHHFITIAPAARCLVCLMAESLTADSSTACGGGDLNAQTWF